MANTGAIKRGFHWSESDGELQIFANGTKVASLHPTNGFIVEVDGFDLAGQTLTSVNASGSTDMTTWLASFAGADGSDDEDPKYALAIKVGGTVAYVPCFATI